MGLSMTETASFLVALNLAAKSSKDCEIELDVAILAELKDPLHEVELVRWLVLLNGC